LIIPLTKKAVLRVELSGAKASNLARLKRSGYPVPSGFVICTPAFQDIMKQTRNRIQKPDSEPLQHRLQLGQETVLQWQLPERLKNRLYKSLGQLKGPYAIRSSLVGEDSLMASFAGQLESFLNVRGEMETIEAIKSCLSSALSWRLVQYIQDKTSLDIEDYIQTLSMGIIVQEMVPAQASGILFTADPVSGRPGTIIEASPGLAEHITQGTTEPDRYMRSETGTLLKHKAADRMDFLLTEDLIRQLELYARRIEQQSGIPRDIEWGWDGETIFLLQDRPITTLLDKKVYSNRMVSDMLPGLIKPLVWTINAEGKLKNTLGRVFTELIGPNEYDFTKLAKQIHFRIYADNSMLGLLLSRMGLPTNFFEMMSREEKAEEKQRFIPNAKSFAFLFRLARFAWKNLRTPRPLQAAIQRHSQQLESFRRRDWGAETEAALLDQIEQLIQLYSDSMWINFIGPINMMIRQKLLFRLLKKHVPDIEPTDVLRGLMGLKSLETDREIQRLAEIARDLDPTTLEFLAEADDEHIRRKLMPTEKGQNLIQAMDAFLDEYGFLSSLGTDISRPPWIENPRVIWHAAAQKIKQGPPQAPVDLNEKREQIQQKVRNQLKRRHRLIYNRRLRSTIKYLQLREQSSFLVSEDSFHLRRAFLALARFLMKREALAQKEDIFYLYLDEIQALISGNLSPREAGALIGNRRAAMEEDARLELPDVIYGDMAAPISSQEEADKVFIEGIVGSAGFIQGKARVVWDPADAPTDLSQNDILVVPFSDMSWTPLFSGVGGLVAETGGLLSHTAIIAREYGLPALVNVKRAMRLIRDGQSVTLDARLGRVYLITQKGE
jgi:pyruvate,water dikinase